MFLADYNLLLAACEFKILSKLECDESSLKELLGSKCKYEEVLGSKYEELYQTLKWDYKNPRAERRNIGSESLPYSPARIKSLPR